MRKQQILRRMVKIINKGKKKNDRVDKHQLEECLDAFKQVMLESIEKGEGFNYRGLLDIETSVAEPRERANPKTQEKFMTRKGYKVNVRLAYSIKQFIKSLAVK